MGSSFLIDRPVVGCSVTLAETCHPGPGDRPKRETGRHQAQADGQALSSACACSLARNRMDASSRGKPSMKAGPKA